MRSLGRYVFPSLSAKLMHVSYSLDHVEAMRLEPPHLVANFPPKGFG